MCQNCKILNTNTATYQSYVNDKSAILNYYDKTRKNPETVKICDNLPINYHNKTTISYLPDSYIPNKNFKDCATGFYMAECSHGTVTARKVICGKEYCPTCGKQGSVLHHRRIDRWFSRVNEFQTCLYLVVTIPAELRKGFLIKKNLTDYRTFVTKKLKRLGYFRGFARYHWSGDCKTCVGKGKLNDITCPVCRGTGSSRIFNPHLNILIEENFFPKEKLECLKKDCAKWLKNRFKITVKNDKVVINAVRRCKDGQNMHSVKYICRSTWFDTRNFEVINVIKNLRNSTAWGKFYKPEPEEIEETEGKPVKLCTCCGETLSIFTHINRNDFLDKYKIYQEITPGVWLAERVPTDWNFDWKNFEKKFANKFYINSS